MPALFPSLQRDRFEQSTALTDLLIAVAALAAARRITAEPAIPLLRRRIWAGAVSGLAISALLGALAHGFTWSSRTRSAIWRPLNFLLSLTVGLFAAAALHDRSGARAALRLLPLALMASLGFEVASHRFQRGFGMLIAYEAAALSAALIGYLQLAADGRLPGAGRISLGLALSLVAAAVQRTDWSIDQQWLALDHNGLFHLVQLAALLPLVDGICAGKGQQS